MPDVARMILVAGQLPNEQRDAGQGPEVGRVALGQGTLEQNGLEVLKLVGTEAGLTSGFSFAPQAGRTVGLPELEPLVRRLAADLTAPGDLGRANALLEEPGGLESSLFHGCVIAFGAHPAATLSEG